MTEKQLLHLLAKRRFPNFYFIDDDDWYVEKFNDNGDGHYKCLICDHKVLVFIEDEYTALVEMFDHGYEHLKESNLLIYL